jgi:hypothetical protein
MFLFNITIIINHQDSELNLYEPERFNPGVYDFHHRAHRVHRVRTETI